MTWPEQFMLQSLDPYRRPEHSYGIFIALACLYQKVLPKNCW